MQRKAASVILIFNQKMHCRLYFLVLLLSLTLAKEQAKQIYLLIEDPPLGGISLILDSLKFRRTPAIFVFNHPLPTFDLASHQIRKAGFPIVTLDQFVEKVSPDEAKILIFPAAALEDIYQLLLQMDSSIQNYQKLGYTFPVWK